VPGNLVGDVSVAPGRPAVPLTPRPRFRAVVRLPGELTSERTPRVRRRFLRALARAPGVMEVDLGKVTYLAPEASARRSGTRFVINRASAPSVRVLRELGIRHLMDEPLVPAP